MKDVLLRIGPWVLVLLGVGALAWRVAELEGRLAAVETLQRGRVAAPATTVARTVTTAGSADLRGGGGGGGGGGGRMQARAAELDLEAPEVREQLAAFVAETQEQQWASRKEEWAARWAEDVAVEVERFGEDAGLSAEATGTVLALLEEMNGTRQRLFAEVKAEEITFLEMRREMREAHESTEGELEALLGPDLFADLSERIPFGPGPR